VGGLFHVDDVIQVEAAAYPRRERQSGVDELNLDLRVLHIGIWSVILRQSMVMLFVLNLVMRCEKT
jgi:hypothetical protein